MLRAKRHNCWAISLPIECLRVELDTIDIGQVENAAFVVNKCATINCKDIIPYWKRYKTRANTQVYKLKMPPIFIVKISCYAKISDR